MRIVINNIAYLDLRNVSISSSADVTGAELPINEYTAEIITDDNIQIGQYAYLFDNFDTLIAKYWIIEAVRYSAEAVFITAQSDIRLLDRATISQELFDHKNFVTAVQEIFVTLYGAPMPDIDAELAEVEITGYCPEQTGRERIQWFCIYAGAYVQQDYGYNIKIKALGSQTAKPILSDVIFYRPQISYGDWVTAIKLAAYSYTETYPTRVQEYIDIEGVYYVETVQYYTVTNANAPAGAPENIIDFSDIKLISPAVAADVLARLALYYFKRVEVSVDVLNEGEIKAGNECVLDIGTGEIITGFVKDVDFSFGNRTKTTLTIGQAEIAEGVELIIQHLYGEILLGQNSFYLPSGFSYSIQNPYISKSGFEQNGDERIYAKTIYAPQNVNAVGIMGSETTTNTQQYDIALRKVSGELKVNIVDEIDGTGTVKIS